MQERIKFFISLRSAKQVQRNFMSAKGTQPCQRKLRGHLRTCRAPSKLAIPEGCRCWPQPWMYVVQAPSLLHPPDDLWLLEGVISFRHLFTLCRMANSFVDAFHSLRHSFLRNICPSGLAVSLPPCRSLSPSHGPLLSLFSPSFFCSGLCLDTLRRLVLWETAKFFNPQRSSVGSRRVFPGQYFARSTTTSFTSGSVQARLGTASPRGGGTNVGAHIDVPIPCRDSRP